MTSSQETSWLTVLSSNRGVSWDVSDSDDSKVGTYTIEVSASAGCVTTKISYTLQIVHFCENEHVTIDCSNSIFL